MTTRFRLAALAAALAACGTSNKTTPGLLLNEPSGVAVFRGYTTKTADLHPYLAIANAATNDLTIVDAVDDVGVPSPVALRTLVYPVPGRPALLASADLGDGKADLLVAVSAGDSKLQVIRTWTAEGVIDADVDLGGDVLALAALPFDPDSVGTVRVAAALSGERLAVVTFARAGNGIVVSGAPAVASLGFQPVALAVIPGDQTRVWAATRDPLPLSGTKHGVAGINITGAPVVVQELDALAPTRLVAAARLRERGPGAGGLDPDAWTTVERVYAVLDESGCGFDAPIACGLVALDSAGTGLAPDFAGELPYRAPVTIPGRALALAASGPPALPPSTDPADQIYAPPFMRIAPATGPRRTTGVAAVASADGALYFVDLGRWEIPSDQVVHTHVAATVTAAGTPATTAGAVDQWLVLEDPASGTTVAHTDPAGLSSSVTLTPGYTPTDRWTVTHEGVLPGLSSRRADSDDAGGGVPWLALQVHVGANFTELVQLSDPSVGVQVGDTVVIEPFGIAGCTATFEAKVDALLPADPVKYPGGAVQLAAKDASNAAWNACLDALAGGVGGGATAGLRATVRAGAYVLVRGTGAAAVQVGRPQLGIPFDVTTPRIAYVAEECAGDAACLARWPGLPDVVGPALSFTLALETGAAAPRDLALVIDTSEGRVPFRVVPPGVTAVAPCDNIAVFDRSRDVPSAGVRFLVPYLSNVVLDATPTVQGGDAKALH